MLLRLGLFAVLALLPAAGEIRLSVTAVDKKLGKPVTTLKAGDFTVEDEGGARRVESAEYVTGPVDVMLLLDTSLLGEVVRPAADDFIRQLAPKEQMAIVSFHSSADLIQDFTSSKELLMRALGTVKFGNSPHLLDALYAAIDGGFEGSSMRRVILLVTAGVDGPSRVTEREVLKLARRNSVSIYPVYAMGYGRGLFESLARKTGGVSFNLRDLTKAKEQIGPRIFEVLRGHYNVILSGVGDVTEKLRLEVKASEQKLFISALPLE